MVLFCVYVSAIGRTTFLLFCRVTLFLIVIVVIVVVAIIVPEEAVTTRTLTRGTWSLISALVCHWPKKYRKEETLYTDTETRICARMLSLSILTKFFHTGVRSVLH